MTGEPVTQGELDAANQLATMIEERAEARKVHADGIYFDLDEQEYHADPALGSGNMKQLSVSPADYWHGSWMNPRRPPDKSTDAQELGKSVHVAVLEGKDAFDARYMRGPDQDEAMTPSDKAARTKKWNALAAAKGMECIPALDYDRIRIASAMIMKNPELGTAFMNGAAEVSVFWTEVRGDKDAGMQMEIRKKARFDYLKPSGVGDLKRVANQFQKSFPQACIDAITNYKYHIQAGHYIEARARLPGLIRKDAVFGAVPPVPEYMEKLATTQRFGWQWVFWQGERAPLTWSRSLSPGNPMVEVARSSLRKAETNFIEYMKRFGPDEQWLDFIKVKELFMEDMPPWFARD